MKIVLTILFLILVFPLYAVVSVADVAGETDSDCIEAAIDKALVTGKQVLIPAYNKRTGGRIWYLDRAILLPSGITLTISNATVRLNAGVQDNIIRNVGTTKEPLEGNSDIHICGLGDAVLSGGTGVSHFTPSGDKSGWPTIGILFYKVSNFTVENLTLENTQAWALSFENGCAHGVICNINFDLQNTIPNQDGVDIRKGCHDITIENLTGTTGDDTVALTGLRRTLNPSEISPTEKKMQIGDRYPADSDDIYDIRIRNIFTSCVGGHGTIRLLNHDGIKLHNVIVENVIEANSKISCSRGIMIGDTNYSTIRQSVLGETYNVFVTNFQSYAKEVVQIKGSLSNAVFQGVQVLGSGKLITVGSMPTQNVTVVEKEIQSKGTPIILQNAILEVDIKPNGMCDCLVATGDLILQGNCQIEVLADNGGIYNKKRFVISRWQGECIGTWVCSPSVGRKWLVYKNNDKQQFELYQPSNMLLILR